MFLLDTHIHTSEVSSCAKVDAETMVFLYKKAGYHGVIITDHLTSENPTQGSFSWKQKIDALFSGFESAKEYGEEAGLTVLPAFEITFYDNSGDYLVYGLDKSWLYKQEDICNTSITYFSDLICNTDSFIVHAHPFRKGRTPQKSAAIPGMEVYNGNPRHNSKNNKALNYAEANSLIQTSGSDFHMAEDCGKGGMIFKKPVLCIEDFITMVKTDSPALIKN